MTSDQFLPTRETYAEELVAAGFTDNGARLRGNVTWTDAGGNVRSSRVQVTFGDAFPFAPPTVNLVGDPGVEVTFHIDQPASGADASLSGNLCLWEPNHPIDKAPWLNPKEFVDRIAGWLELTAAGWPDDYACDLERYLPNNSELVLFNSQDTSARDRVAVRVQSAPADLAVRMTTEPTRIERILRDNLRPKNVRRKDLSACWIEDVGELTHPIRSWPELLGVVADSTQLGFMVTLGAVRYVHLRYTRNGNPGVLVLRVGAPQIVEACSCADESPAALQLRAGPQATSLADASVAIIGCGAIGSFAADLLYRSGAREFHLYDADTLRPGNVVRHVGTLDEVGKFKVDVVREQLIRLGADRGAVKRHTDPLRTLEFARRIVAAHDLVLDATAGARATSLLAVAAAEHEATVKQNVVLSACVQRQGQVARVDRLTVSSDEQHLRPLVRDPAEAMLEDPGCGSPTSVTPPSSVLRAAVLVVDVAVQELTERGSAPATTVDVIVAQPEAPYDATGRVTSPPPGATG